MTIVDIIERDMRDQRVEGDDLNGDDGSTAVVMGALCVVGFIVLAWAVIGVSVKFLAEVFA